MAETTYYPEVRCDVSPGGLLPEGVTAIVTDVEGRQQFVQVTEGLINRESDVAYLPVGFVKIDRRKRWVLIELPTEADSGANRMWVDFDSLKKEKSSDAEVVA